MQDVIEAAETVADFEALLNSIAGSLDAPRRAVAALSQVRKGVITGEGPSTSGRVHYSRCLDAADAALIRRILTAVGDRAVTRAEADALFDIHDAALERADGGAFDELFVKAIAHHVLTQAGFRAPARRSALAPTTPVASWGASHRVGGEAAAWLASRLRRKSGKGTALAQLSALIGASPRSDSVATVVDLAA